MTETPTDIMIDVQPGLTIYRVGGEWRYSSRRDLSLPGTIKELREQVSRLALRLSILTEAADSMEKKCSSPTSP